MSHEAGAADEVALLRGRVAALESQVAALADANAVAAELMAELDEARAVEAALVRRAEEVEVQRRIDAVVLRCDDEDALLREALETLMGAPALELAPHGAIFVEGDGGLWEAVRVGDADTCRARAMAGVQALVSAQAGTWDEGGAVQVVLRSRAERLGVLCVEGRPGLGWRDRWFELLLSFGAQVGSALARLRASARNVRLVAELAEARDRALAATRAKDLFLATMSHELRTPLNAIIGYGELLLEEAASGSGGVEDLRRIVGSGRHLLGLINEILDLAKIEAGKVELVQDRFTVAGLVHDVSEMVAPLVAQQGNALEVEIDGSAGEMVADVGRLRQVLLNLLGNACKFTHGGTIRLAVAACEDGVEVEDEVVFTVADEGIGMDEEQLARVFEPFVQADATTTRRYGGTGLGLTICGHYVALMGGSITATSVPGVGTRFEVFLPRRPPSAS